MKILNEGESAAVVVQGTHILKYLNGHLKSNNAKIREMAAMNLGSISYNSIGRE